MGTATRAPKHLFWSSRAGTAAIEFGLFVPFFVVLILGTITIGFGIYQAMQAYNAAQAGMLYAAKNGWSEAGISSAVVNASSSPGISASPAPTQFCACPASSGLTEVACGTTCDSGAAAGRYIRIYATVTLQTVFPPGAFNLPSTLTAQAVVRTD